MQSKVHFHCFLRVNFEKSIHIQILLYFQICFCISWEVERGFVIFHQHEEQENPIRDGGGEGRRRGKQKMMMEGGEVEKLEKEKTNRNS